MQTHTRFGSLSLDLDNQWAYLKTHGDAGWEKLPSYLQLVAPRILNFLHDRRLTITCFVVGQDADRPENEAALRMIANAGHEIGNHSYHHEPWLHRYSDAEIEREITLAEDAIWRVTGQRPIGFRGPGYSVCPAVLRVLIQRGYRYDASTFPTYLGPLARLYYFMTARLSSQQKRERQSLFGSFGNGVRPNRPHWWKLDTGSLVEIPVTTMPLLRTPIHASYVLYLSQFSRGLARCYFRFALRLCQLTRTTPSLLLHPLDFLGCDDTQDLEFFPGMRVPSAKKLAWLAEVIDHFRSQYRIVTLREQASMMGVPSRQPCVASSYARAPAVQPG
jgi:hypothetical protein